MVGNNFIYPLESISIIEDYFRANFPRYNQTEKGMHAGFWWVSYCLDVILVRFDGDIGGVFHVYIHIDGKEYPLWQYNKKIISHDKTNSKNILFALNMVRDFLYESNIQLVKR